MKDTGIQWCHSTVNPVMGCLGCELFPTPEQLLRLLERAFAELGLKVDSRKLFKKLISAYFAKIKNPGPGHLNEITTTNVWHLREIFAEKISQRYGSEVGEAVLDTIRERMKCYAAKLHLNRAANIVKPGRKLNPGYASTFEQFAMFEGRMAEAAKWADLAGTSDPDRPWLDGLCRLIFLSDMGDALSSKALFPFLRGEMSHVTSENGRRHFWLWLTKRPQNMEKFAASIGGSPPNVCAMTTVTSTKTLHRVDKLRQVKAACRGLSIEPLWERIPPERLNLKGIDWVIVGGESGNGKLTAPFHLEWAEELMEHCRRNGVAFFMKQVGRMPHWKGTPLTLVDSHGGDWNEWPKKFRVRQFPVNSVLVGKPQTRPGYMLEAMNATAMNHNFGHHMISLLPVKGQQGLSLERRDLPHSRKSRNLSAARLVPRGCVKFVVEPPLPEFSVTSTSGSPMAQGEGLVNKWWKLPHLV